MPSQPPPNLTHVKQRPRECVLATIACIRSLPYSRIRAYANRAAKDAGATGYADMWDRHCLAPRRSVLTKIATKYGLPPGLFYVRYGDVLMWCNLSRITAPDLTGTGVVFTHNGESFHVVAFQNGRVYDSSLPMALAATDWRDLRVDSGLRYAFKLVRLY